MSQVGRNDPCPCGSGRKHKHCCLRKGIHKARRVSDPELEQIWSHYQANRFSQAEALCRQALLRAPDDPDLLHVLGVLALKSGRAADAVDLIQRAIGQDDSNAGFFLDLGRSYCALERYEEADAFFNRAFSIAPDDSRLRFGAGMAFALAGRMQRAIRSFQDSLKLDPKFALAHYNLGLALMNLGRIDESAESYEHALEIQPGDFNARVNLGIVYVRQGKIDAALACFKQAAKLRPGDDRAYYNLGLALLYADAGPEELFDWHRKITARLEAKHAAPMRRHSNSADPGRKLRIGYLSPDFRQHSVASFIEPVIARHDRANFEICCYFNHPTPDQVSERIEASADHWRPCHGLSDDQLAGQIETDNIDILVDLAGHMRGNRLAVFARKPAPVQVSYLGYPATTGLAAMDYRLVTLATDPPGQERWHTEKLYRLPGTLWCYRPPESGPEFDQQPPVVRNGHPTFGSMNNIAKLSNRTIACWAEIMQRLPDAKLVMTGIPEHSGRASLRERFRACGIDRERVSIHDRLPAREYRDLLQNIDIALDPFPYNGTTTSCETLYNGIPVISLIGNTSVSRSGYALLELVGLPELAAQDEAAYVDKAVALASDPERLGHLRAGLQDRFAKSPLRDEEGFTRELESAFRDMWQTWCQENTPANTASRGHGAAQ